MYIKSLRIANFRHLRDVRIDPTHQTDSSGLVVLAGPNGGGKSTILEAISLSVASSFAYNMAFSRQTPEHSFEVDFGLTTSEVATIQEWHTQTGNPQFVPKEELEQLVDRRWYTRYFGPTNAGIDRQQHERAHNLVMNVLRQSVGRPIGFALKADRSYSVHGFQAANLINMQIDRQARTSNVAYQLPDFQYRDMLDFLIEEQYHYIHALGLATLKSGIDSASPSADKMPVSPIDEYNVLFSKLMPGYSIVTAENERVPTNLWVSIPSGEVISFNDLSSGEKEVFFILANFIRQDVQSAIVIVDEPELHLHPDLTRKLVGAITEIKPGNQIWLSTHNGEVIEEAGFDRTYFVSRNKTTGTGTVERAMSAGAPGRLLRELLGYSGYVSSGEALLFLEGNFASLDRKIFSRLLGDRRSSVKIIPAGGVSNVERVNAAVLKIIETGVADMQCYAIRDRDYLSDDEISSYNSHESGRVRVLRRCHIENYILDPMAISIVLEETFSQEAVSPDLVKEELYRIASGMSAEILSAFAAYRLQRLSMPEDFRPGTPFRNTSLFEVDGGLSIRTVDAVKGQARDAAVKARERAQSRLTDVEIDAVLAESEMWVNERLDAEYESDDSWSRLFPGKRLLEEYCKVRGIDPLPFENSLVLYLAKSPSLIPRELARLLDSVCSALPKLEAN